MTWLGRSMRAVGDQSGLLTGAGLGGLNRLGRELVVSRLFSIVITDDASNVVAGLAVGRHTAIMSHPVRPGVIRGQRLHRVVIELLKQLTQVACAGLDVLVAVE